MHAQETLTAGSEDLALPAPDLATRFDAGAALADVVALCADDFTGRRIGTGGHDLVQSWLLGRMREIGLAAQLQEFRFEQPLLEQYAPATFSIVAPGQHPRALQARRDFAEHPRSADTPRPVRGVVRRWSPALTALGAWAMLGVVPQGRAFDELVKEAQARGVVGILTPQQPHTEGYLSKRVIYAAPVSLPVMAVRSDLLPTLEGMEIAAALPLRAVPGKGANVLGRLAGTDPSLAQQPLILSAHYDGVGDDPGGLRLPAATDNAAALSIVLEVARSLSRLPTRPHRSIIFAALDAEEIGAFGSLAHARMLRELDMEPLVLNVDGAGRFHGEITIDPSPNAAVLLEALDGAGRALDIPLVVGTVASDNRRYAGVGFAAAGVASGGYGYHTPADTLQHVEPEAMRAVGQLLLETLTKLAY